MKPPHWRRTLAATSILLSACAPGTASAPPTRLQSQLTAPAASMASFAAERARGPLRANGEIARDFLDLAFKMESGRALPTLTRFEGQITVRLTGQASSSMAHDLRQLLSRLRAEAGLDIVLTGAPDAAVTIEAIPRAQLHRFVPKAACFVVPRVSNWGEYLSVKNTGRVDWTTLRRRDRATIFLPSDAPPQEARDCLHEELAQALGPLNDLYRLPDSVFNDDNIHAVLTRFDMLVLRLYYAPELRNGMSRAEVAARLPRLLRSLNPGGERASATPMATPRAWISAMETALGSRAPRATRETAARRAVEIANSAGWNDNRTAFANYALGRLLIQHDTAGASAAFRAAHRRFASDPQTQLHSAYTAVQLSAFALSRGRSERVLRLTASAIPVARTHQNAALLATLKMFRAEALEQMGQTAAAKQERLDSLGWARYGFGTQGNVQARLREVAQLNPMK